MPVAFNGLLYLPKAFQGNAEIVPGHAQAWLDFDGLAVAGDGVLPPALALQSQPQIVACGGVIGSQTQQLLIAADGIVEASLQEEHIGEFTVGIAVARLGIEHLTIDMLRVGEVACLVLLHAMGEKLSNVCHDATAYRLRGQRILSSNSRYPLFGAMTVYRMLPTYTDIAFADEPLPLRPVC